MRTSNPPASRAQTPHSSKAPPGLPDGARGAVVVLLEHTGFEGAATFTRVWIGGHVNKRLQVRLRRFAAVAIPRVGRDEWLFERWAEMDAWIVRSDTNEGDSI